MMTTNRPATFAGRFYPGEPAACQRAVENLLAGVASPAAIGAVVPHAGWMYSGATAALGLAGIAAYAPESVVLFGAVHGPDPSPASVFGRGMWETPLGDLSVDQELATRLVDGVVVCECPDAHRHEHAIEVQLPILKYLLRDVRIIPISVRPGSQAAAVGRNCARRTREAGNRRVAFVASTDLTHYGPAFDYEPHGSGWPGIRWAKEVNDRRMIALIQRLRSDEVVAEAEIQRNACGPGAIAALLAAMQEFHVERYQELRHVCSAEVHDDDVNPVNSVGYEAGVFLA